MFPERVLIVSGNDWRNCCLNQRPGVLWLAKQFQKSRNIPPRNSQKLNTSLILDVGEVSYTGLWPEVEKIAAQSNVDIDSCLIRRFNKYGL